MLENVKLPYGYANLVRVKMAVLARGTVHWVAFFGLLSVTLVAIIVLFAPPIFSGVYFSTIFCIFLTLFLGWFFRDPERAIADGIIAPADGYVQRIEDVEFDEKPYWKVVTFMNVHNVHVNRAPIDGKITNVEHFPGAHLPAYNKDSERNERVTSEWDTPIGKIKLVQIAGIIARRIVPYIHEGQVMKKGERIGIIRLGSRVDVYLPKDRVKLNVKVGQKVLACSSRIGTIVEGGSK